MAVPTTFTVTELVNTDGRSCKFYRIWETRSGNVYTQWGRTGTAGQAGTSPKPMWDIHDAKVAKNYRPTIPAHLQFEVTLNLADHRNNIPPSVSEEAFRAAWTPHLTGSDDEGGSDDTPFLVLFQVTHRRARPFVHPDPNTWPINARIAATTPGAAFAATTNGSAAVAAIDPQYRAALGGPMFTTSHDRYPSATIVPIAAVAAADPEIAVAVAAQIAETASTANEISSAVNAILT